MQRGTKHKPETIQKLKQHWAAVKCEQSNLVGGEVTSPTTETDVLHFLQGLDDDDFMAFFRTHMMPRYKEIKGI